MEGYKDQSLELVIKPFGNWKVSTGLEKLSDNRYRAVTYDILADCPIEIGEHRINLNNANIMNTTVRCQAGEIRRNLNSYT